MIQNEVCAIFTTFRPEPDILQNIQAVRSQVQSLVVVDNGSSPEAVALLMDAAKKHRFHVICNRYNTGIATALNIGSRWATEQGSKFLLFFDQDSTATDGMVAALLEIYRTFESSKPIGLVSTTNRERRSGDWHPPLHDRFGEPVLTMTSGTLLPTPVFEDCGPFEDDFFIEFVDHEYCLRLRSRGYRMVLCASAVLIHDVGFPRIHSFLGLIRCKCTNHPPQRRYYFVRNLTVLIFRYWLTEPHWCWVECLSLLKGALKITFFEKEPMRKHWMSVRGFIDAMRGTMGERILL